MRIKLLFSMITLITLKVCGQSTTSNPYSYYGIGETEGLDNAIFGGIGNCTLTSFDSTILNTFNPATYNTIGKNYPLFSFGISTRASFYNEYNVQHFDKSIVPYHFALGMSFTKNMGLAFGIKPFSRKDYTFTTKELIGSDSIQNIYTGTGATNEVFLGYSLNLINLKKSKLSVGTNLGYLFGTLTDTRSSNIIGNSDYAIGKKELFIKTFHYDLGLYYRLNLDNHLFTFSAVAEPSQFFKSHYSDSTMFSDLLSDGIVVTQTISSEQNSGNIQIGTSLNLGLAYKYYFNQITKKNQTLNSSIEFHVNYAQTNWNEFQSDFNHLNNDYIKGNTMRLNFGLQYVPQTKIYENALKTNFMNRLNYRAGFYNYSLPYANSNYSDQGYTIGFGIPILTQNLSSLNFSFSYGNRKNDIPDMLREQYYGMSIGLIIAPNVAEKWFNKRKLD
jgi:hypothetical protein